MGNALRKLRLIYSDPADAELGSTIIRQTRDQCQVCIATDQVRYCQYLAAGGFDAVVCEARLGWTSAPEVLASVQGRHGRDTRLILTG